MAWCFVKEDDVIYRLDVIERKRSTPVVKITPKEEGKLMLLFEEGSTELVEMKEFKAKNAFSQQFVPCLPSRSRFYQKFKELLKSLKNQQTESDDSRNGGDEDLIGPSLSNEASQMQGQNEAGVIDIHIENLVAPAPERATRALTDTHVQALERSFSIHTGQFKILVGILSKGSLDSCKVVNGCEVEILGGNHTRAALQSLYRRGIVTDPYVKVKVYRELSREECLRVGVEHNSVDETSRSMTFIEEAGLIREMMAAHPSDHAEVCAKIFHAENKRRYQWNKKLAIDVAKSSEPVWETLMTISSRWNEKKAMKQTFLRKWVQVRDPERQKGLLNTYIEEGRKAFDKAVDLALNKCVKSKEKTNSVVEDGSLNEQKVKELSDVIHEQDEKIENLENQNQLLKEQNSELLEELKDLRAKLDNCSGNKDERTNKCLNEQKENRKRVTETDDLCVGDVIKALWKDKNGESWYDAEVQKIYGNGDCQVKYVEDGFVLRIKKSWTRK